MTAHTPLTDAEIDELQIALLRLAMKLGNDELERKFARLCAQAKSHVGAGGAVDDAKLLDGLSDLYRACPHAVLTFNDDEDDDRAPVGYSISIDGCESVEYVGETLRDAIRASIREFEPATPSPAQEAMPPYNDAEVERMWLAAGGRFYGPNVETGAMPKLNLLRFMRELQIVAIRAHCLALKGK